MVVNFQQVLAAHIPVLTRTHGFSKSGWSRGPGGRPFGWLDRNVALASTQRPSGYISVACILCTLSSPLRQYRRLYLALLPIYTLPPIYCDAMLLLCWPLPSFFVHRFLQIFFCRSSFYRPVRRTSPCHSIELAFRFDPP